MHVELSMDRSPWDLGLELLGDLGLDQKTLAMWAGVGQTGLVDFVDLIGRWRWAMAVGAVQVTGLATGTFGLRLGRSFAERSGLPLAGAANGVEFAAQASVLRQQRLGLAL